MRKLRTLSVAGLLAALVTLGVASAQDQGDGTSLGGTVRAAADSWGWRP